MNDIKKRLFRELDIRDVFFDSLKKDYPGFIGWFKKKADENESAYILDKNGIQGFLYLKVEDEIYNNIKPTLKKFKRLKVGTFKINAHGTNLGERFIKILIDEIFKEGVSEAYVTIFPKHEALIKLLEKYGFKYFGVKSSDAGEENVYLKSIKEINNDILMDYPRVNYSGVNKFMLSIWPKYHTKMFPDSKLKTEKNHIIEDLSITNSIEKIYLSGADLSNYKKNDIVLIYRTKDKEKSASYSSVATSICVIEEVKHIDDFKDYNEFKRYCIKHSVFSEYELGRFWKSKQYKYLIKMLYNVALPKRIVRQDLINKIGLDKNRWVAVNLTDKQFEKILRLGEVNESIIINQTTICSENI
ncbi:GNAT family N-acetyltransferase [Clostridium septicum]|uniref:N-acetyltransferase n=1 Tax=Clostridium septicum TaxID=1504 RepID=A0A9N7PKC3_CLOSE|nr:hypothetical protein [Clostridium septicum]AYE35711.1 hypothetical protein CP523_15425 [Clostridium septicum]UEC19613.1 hypothetical protein LK444_09275 [Clostridium septicum]USS02326.1 hypothetical protein NH397_07900 [Clostridium septicum]